MFTFHMISQSNYSIFCHENKVTIQNNIIVMCTVATDYVWNDYSYTVTCRVKTLDILGVVSDHNKLLSVPVPGPASMSSTALTSRCCLWWLNKSPPSRRLSNRG